MAIAEFLKLLPLLIEAGKLVPAIADLIRRVENGDKIGQEEVDAEMSKVRNAVANWDNTPAG
ncbi:MAG TPA: hypothetical protein VMW24_28630 [Sedimentisphaerales bacterium]|nr:hypothetical protein [Sedimentisphaerales bacterium]